MVMALCRCDEVHIAQLSRFMATLDATGNCHWASICLVLPWRTPWSLISAQKIELWHCETAVSKLAFKRHKTDPLLSSSKQQAAWKGQTPRLKPKSLAIFVAIKRVTMDKIGDITDYRNSLWKGGRSWAPIGVKLYKHGDMPLSKRKPFQFVSIALQHVWSSGALGTVCHGSGLPIEMLSSLSLISLSPILWPAADSWLPGLGGSCCTCSATQCL